MQIGEGYRCASITFGINRFKVDLKHYWFHTGLKMKPAKIQKIDPPTIIYPSNGTKCLLSIVLFSAA